MLFRSVLFPVHAIAFALRVEGAYWGLSRIPHWAGWASILSSLAAGATALTLLRSFPEVGGAMGALGVFAVSYAVGVVLDAALLATFNAGERK